MALYEQCFVIAKNRSAALELVGGAAGFAGEVALVCLGRPVSAEGVSRVYALSDGGLSAAAYCGAVAALIKEQQPGLVLVEQSRDGRLLAGIAAAALGVSVQTDPYEVIAGENGVVSKKLSYGGLAALTEESASHAVLCVGAGVFGPAAEAEPGEVEELSAVTGGIETLEKREKAVQRTNLASARRIVGVGISGQIQHTAGCDQSGLIFAVNKDENAPIFKGCDFGVVGDLNNVIPRLMEALENK